MTELDIEPIHTPVLDALERQFERLAVEEATAVPRSRERRRWVLPATATGIAGLAAVLAVALLSFGGVQPTTASALAQVADVAEHAPGSGLLGPGEYWYVRTQSDEQHVVFEQWQDAAGHVRLRRTPLAPASDPPATDRRTTSSGFALGLFSYDELRTLPTDPAALLARIGDAIERDEAWAGGDPATKAPLEANEFLAIGLLLDAPGTSELRAALYRAAALIPGVQYVGAVTDPLGRAGEAVAFAAPNAPVQGGTTPTKLVYDPDTGALLSLQSSRTTFSIVVAGAVDGIDALPAGLAPVGE